MRFAAGHNLGREKPVNADFLPAFLALASFHAAIAMSADDLLIFLLDLIASALGRQWLPFTLAFLNAYDNAPVIVQLSHQLTPRSGMPWIWRGVQTSFAKSR